MALGDMAHDKFHKQNNIFNEKSVYTRVIVFHLKFFTLLFY